MSLLRPHRVNIYVQPLLCVSNDLFLSNFEAKISYCFLISPLRAVCPTNIFPLPFISRKLKIMMPFIRSILHFTEFCRLYTAALLSCVAEDKTYCAQVLHRSCFHDRVFLQKGQDKTLVKNMNVVSAFSFSCSIVFSSHS
jgi:hypothetical protein